MLRLWLTFKILIRGRFKDAWNFYNVVGQEKFLTDFTDKDFEVYYPDTD